MEEDIKRLKRRVNVLKLEYALTQPELEVIENLINRNKKLEKEKLSKEAWRKLANTYKKDLDNSISKDILKKDLKYMKNAKAKGIKQLFMKRGIVGYLEKLLGDEK